MENQRRFRYQNKSVIIDAQLVEGIKYKFVIIVEGSIVNEYEQEVNGLQKALDLAVEHAKSIILMST